MENKPPVRVNTRFSADTNDWLDQKSIEMALSKTALITLAVENYRKETETLKLMPEVVRKLKEMGANI